MRLDIHQYGIFEGDVSSMPILAEKPKPLQAGSHKYGSLTADPKNFLTWVFGEFREKPAANMREWLGDDYKAIFG